MLLPVLLACALVLPVAPAAPAVPSAHRAAAPPGAATVAAVDDGADVGYGDEPLRLRTEQAADGETRIDVTAPGTAHGTRATRVRLLGGGRTLADLPVLDGHATLTTNTGVPAAEITACVLTTEAPRPCTHAAAGTGQGGEDDAPGGSAALVPVTVTVPPGGLVLSSPVGDVAVRPVGGGRGVGVARTLLTDTRPGRTTATVVLSVDGGAAHRTVRVVPQRPSGLAGNGLDPRAFTPAPATVLPTGGGTAAVARRSASAGTGAVRLAALVELGPEQSATDHRHHGPSPLTDHGRGARTPTVTVVWTAF